MNGSVLGIPRAVVTGGAGEVRRSRLDVSRAREELGLERGASLDEGLRDTLTRIRSLP